MVEAERSVAEKEAAVEARIATLDPQEQNEWISLQADERVLLSEEGRWRSQVREAEKAIKEAEEELMENPLKGQALLLQEETRVLTDRRYEIFAELERMQQPIDAQKAIVQV